MLLLRYGRAGDNGVRAPVNSLVVGESGADAEMEGKWKGTPAAVTGNPMVKLKVRTPIGSRQGRCKGTPAVATTEEVPFNHKDQDQEQDRRRYQPISRRSTRVEFWPAHLKRVSTASLHPRGDFPSQHSMGVSPQGFHTPSQLEWGWFSTAQSRVIKVQA
jgi:hypothetical protein